MNGDIDEDDLFLLAPEMRAKCREITNEDPQRWNLATPTKIDLNKHATLSRKLQKFVEKQSLRKRASIVSMISMTSIDESEEVDGSVESLKTTEKSSKNSKSRQKISLEQAAHTNLNDVSSDLIDENLYEDLNEEFFDAEDDFEIDVESISFEISDESKDIEDSVTPAQKAQVKLSSVSEETLDGRNSSSGSRSLVSSTNSDRSNLSPRTLNDQSALQNVLTLPMKKEKKHVIIAEPEPKDQVDGNAKKSVMTQSAHPALTTTPLSRKMSAGNERENLRHKEEISLSISPMTALTIQLDGLNLQKPITSASATFPMSLQEQSNRITSVSHTASLNEINELARQQEEALRRMASLSGLAPTRIERASRLPKPTIRTGIPQPGFTGKRPLSARSTSAHPPEYWHFSSLESAKVEQQQQQQQQRSGAFTARSAPSQPATRGRLRAPSAHTPHRLRPLQLRPNGVVWQQNF